jgi:hypothetical protein
MKLKHRKIIFLLLIALLAGSSMAVYTESQANFWLKTIELVLVQQAAAMAIYLCCLGWDVIHPRTTAAQAIANQPDSSNSMP